MTELFKVTLDGNMCVVEAEDSDDAERIALHHMRPYRIDIDYATDEDVAWLKGMGGRILK